MESRKQAQLAAEQKEAAARGRAQADQAEKAWAASEAARKEKEALAEEEQKAREAQLAEERTVQQAAAGTPYYTGKNGVVDHREAAEQRIAEARLKSQAEQAWEESPFFKNQERRTREEEEQALKAEEDAIEKDRR